MCRIWTLALSALLFHTACTSPPSRPDEAARIRVYVVAAGDGGRSGEALGCGDSLVALDTDLYLPSSTIQQAFDALLAIPPFAEGEEQASPRINTIAGKDLRVRAWIDGDAAVLV